MKKLKKVDVVIVGMGWTGGLIAQELSGKGLKVVGLERGAMRVPEKDFVIPFVRDELKFQQRRELQQNLARETITFRNKSNERALPMRNLGSFLPGEGLGGAGLHWNGMSFRNTHADHELRSVISNRYGKKRIPSDMDLRDWPQTYSELETHYSEFEQLCGVSGKAGNIKGNIQPGGNPFEAPRSKDYPLPPLESSLSNDLFNKASRSLGYNPYPLPAANCSKPYKNQYGDVFGQCQYCGHCELFACESNAKASPNITVLKRPLSDKDFELKTHSWVTRLKKGKGSNRIEGVYYTNMQSGEEYFQPAETVFLCAWTLNNVHLLLNSGIGAAYDPKTGDGLVGKNYCYQVMAGARLFFEKKELNTFMGAGALGSVVDNFNSENFDHSQLSFLGGGFIANLSMGARPISSHPVPPGTPKYGTEWKKAVQKWYNRNTLLIIHGSNYPSRLNYLSLDPTYKNVFGQKLLRMTFNFTDNDRNMMEFLQIRLKKIIKEMNPTHTAGPKKLSNNYNIVPYQSTHNTGGAIMGTSPADSVVNKYCQSWDHPNLFILGASAFPQNTGYNPTLPLGALSYYVAKGVKEKYLKKPGALI